MFEFIPITGGLYFNYRENLCLLTVVGVILISLTCFTISWITKLIGKEKVIDKNKKYIKVDPDTASSSLEGNRKRSSSLIEQEQDSGDDLQLAIRRNHKKNRWLKASYLCNWLGWFFNSYFLGNFSMYGQLVGTDIAILFMFGVLTLKLVHQEKIDRAELDSTLHAYGTEAHYTENLRKHRKFYKKLFVWFIFLSIFFPVFWHGFCVSSFHEYIGPIFGTASLSTSILRYFQVSEFCPVGAPCHIYATLPEDASTGVFINAHTNVQYENITVMWDTEDYYANYGELRYWNTSQGIEIDGVDSAGERRVHSVLLTNLTPSTMYKIMIMYQGDFLTDVRYKTFPDENSNETIIIASGGDNGDTALGKNMTLDSAVFNPDLILVGGDIAYDNGMCTCYFAWDYFLYPFEEINKKAGRLIPFLFSIGNHDAGVDSISGRSVTVTTQGPFYMVYFPQHSVRGSDNSLIQQVPTLEQRKSYHYHKIGKMLIMALDSGSIVEYIGEQDTWMRDVLEDHPDLYKVADYHFPTYQGCDNYLVYDLGYQRRMELWNPLFDQYQFLTVFENHEHIFKKTHPLRDGKKHENGTLYLGNGGWGTWINGCEVSNNTDIFDKVVDTQHYWIMKYTPSEGKVYYSAYDPKLQEIIPTFSQKLEGYIR